MSFLWLKGGLTKQKYFGGWRYEVFCDNPEIGACPSTPVVMEEDDKDQKIDGKQGAVDGWNTRA